MGNSVDKNLDIKGENCDDKPDVMTQNEVIFGIIENYKSLEVNKVKELNFTEKHPGTVGSHRELIWKDIFERIIPKKFAIEQGVFIIDSKGNISNEVDLAIFDEQYTPYVFQYGKIKYIPIEAVAVVVECKSKSWKKNQLKEWSQSISDLKTSSKSFVRTATAIEFQSAPTQTATRPIKILCHVEGAVESGVNSYFDIVIASKGDKLIISKEGECDSLFCWYKYLNHGSEERYSVGKNGVSGYALTRLDQGEVALQNTRLSNYKIHEGSNEITLLSLTFKLNQLLMLINNPMFFPHQAYVDMFNKELNSEEGGE